MASHPDCPVATSVSKSTRRLFRSLPLAAACLLFAGLTPIASAAVADPARYLAPILSELERDWPRNRTINIVCHGHSVPAGYFKTPVVDSFNAYPLLLHRALKERFPHAVINVIVTAIGGEDAARGAARFERDVLTHRPDLLCLDYSLNDRRLGLEVARSAWVAMITQAQAAGAKVILLTPTPDTRAKLDDPADALVQHAAQVRQLAAAHGTGLVDSLARFQTELTRDTPLLDLLSQSNHPNTRGHQLVATALLEWFPAPRPGEITVANPLVRQRADPHLTYHRDGWYYFTATVPEYDRLELRRARTLDALATAAPRTIWQKHATGPMGSHIWAPELHFINGKWYVYFAAGGAEKDTVWNIRIYVLENAAANPLEGEWIERGQLKTNWESFALDATTFVHRGTRYLAWAQKDPKIKGNTNLYLAKMASPTAITGAQVMISRPEFPWEQIRYWVNEGPAVLIRNGRVFLTYSAAGTGAEYCLGLLTADENADLLDPSSWKKSPEPVFRTHADHGIFGPGHNSFTTSADGRTDLLVYHARSYRDIPGDPLHDPNRHTRVQPIAWRADGTPDFGVPAAETKP
jgi:GH43 family beta-xylosidase/lysophospholipase L1-like esterase